MEPKAPAPEDIELVERIERGQKAAEAALFEKYSARVYYLALRQSRSREDAEDIRSETFLRVIQAIRQNHVRSAGALSSFILSTTRNVVYESFRELKADQRVEDAEDLAEPAQDAVFLDLDVRQAIEQTIGRLKPREQELLRLHYYEELPKEEIARRLGIAAERVRLVKSRALKNFRDIYQRLNKATSSKDADTKQA